MPFSSMDDLVNKISSGNSFRIDWQKSFLPTTGATAGEWFFLARGAGNPPADTLFNTGTNLAFQATSDTTVGVNSIQHGGNVSPLTKHIVNASAYSAAATSAPAILMLIDVLGFIRVTSVTATGDQTVNNAVSIPRYTDGLGVQAFMYANNATPLGAATPNLSITYTNTADVTGRVTPAVLPIGKSAANNGVILYSGTGNGKYGPFMPLASGDRGIKRIDFVRNATSYVSGEYSVVLCRPLLTLPLVTIGVATERDLVNQLPSLPRVFDGACLHWLVYAGVGIPTNTPYFGHLEFGWA